MKHAVDIKGIIARLKKELGLKYDNELSERLGMDSRYISVIKSREVIGGEVWNKIISIAREKGIDLNWLIWGQLGSNKRPEDIIIDTISETISDPQEKKQAIAKLKETLVAYRSIPEEQQEDEVLELALRLIFKLMQK